EGLREATGLDLGADCGANDEIGHVIAPLPVDRFRVSQATSGAPFARESGGSFSAAGGAQSQPGPPEAWDPGAPADQWSRGAVPSHSAAACERFETSSLE